MSRTGGKERERRGKALDMLVVLSRRCKTMAALLTAALLVVVGMFVLGVFSVM